MMTVMSQQSSAMTQIAQTMSMSSEKMQHEKAKKDSKELATRKLLVPVSDGVRAIFSVYAHEVGLLQRDMSVFAEGHVWPERDREGIDHVQRANFFLSLGACVGDEAEMATSRKGKFVLHPLVAAAIPCHFGGGPAMLATAPPITVLPSKTTARGGTTPLERLKARLPDTTFGGTAFPKGFELPEVEYQALAKSSSVHARKALALSRLARHYSATSATTINFMAVVFSEFYAAYEEERLSMDPENWAWLTMMMQSALVSGVDVPVNMASDLRSIILELAGWTEQQTDERERSLHRPDGKPLNDTSLVTETMINQRKAQAAAQRLKPAALGGSQGGGHEYTRKQRAEDQGQEDQWQEHGGQELQWQERLWRENHRDDNPSPSKMRRSDCDEGSGGAGSGKQGGGKQGGGKQGGGKQGGGKQGGGKQGGGKHGGGKQGGGKQGAGWGKGGKSNAWTSPVRDTEQSW
jgi:hypothetical protein